MRIEHRNVLRLFDAFRIDDDTPVLAMELLEGETLAAYLERVEVLDWATFAPVLTGIVSAVEAAHQAGIIHRDLKPSNVFLVREPRFGTATSTDLVRVLDFGVSKLVDVEGAEGADTESGATLGTPQYMAPEQALGDKTLSFAVDVWALGVMTYECLSGGRPVEGDSLGQVIRQLLQGSITPLEHVRPDLPIDVKQMVARMLAESPKDRPSVQDIKKWLDARSDEHPFAAPRRVSKWRRRATSVVWAFGLAALFALPAALAVKTGPAPSEPPTVRLNVEAQEVFASMAGDEPGAQQVATHEEPPPARVEPMRARDRQEVLASDRARLGAARPRTPRQAPRDKPPSATVPEPGHEFAHQPAVPGGLDEAPF
jgi:serine/threonine protein kinase